jgi:hypothetical protein
LFQTKREERAFVLEAVFSGHHGREVQAMRLRNLILGIAIGFFIAPIMLAMIAIY